MALSGVSGRFFDLNPRKLRLMIRFVTYFIDFVACQALFALTLLKIDPRVNPHLFEMPVLL
jgi:hypothetical protein